MDAQESKKPFQFHTGLGDNDIDLGLSNPSHLQNFIKTYPTVAIVLLHASYPFTKEAGYLATVYHNVYLDIGEVFPFVSQDGQEYVLQEALELCPSEKLLWSTDGHWFPETYILAVLQVREAMANVLSDYVRRGVLTTPEAIKIVEDIFFNNSNKLYNLQLNFSPNAIVSAGSGGSEASLAADFKTVLERFLETNPSVRFLRLQWLDYTATLRLRLLPKKQALEMVQKKSFLGITKAVLGLLQADITCPGFAATGEYALYPQFEGLRLAARAGHATVQCEFREENGDDVPICPRTVLRKQVENASRNGMKFLVGFEVEVVFMSREVVEGEFHYGGAPVNEGGHAWSAARAMQGDETLDLVEKIVDELGVVGVEVQQFHPEASPGQYEFVLAPQAPLDAVDTLLAAREIISLAAANADLRATYFPKPSAKHPGTGAHLHISMTPGDSWRNFYAGVLNHLQAIAAFTYPNDASYERVANGVWAGSTFIAWGKQNRETPIRQIRDSRFEIRCIDGLSNPYLVLASIIGAGLRGVIDRDSMMEACLVDPSILSEKQRADLGIRQQFPKDLDEAINYLKADTMLADILGQSVIDTYVVVKEEESKMLKDMEPEKRRNWLIERY